ncbi:MAG TPA: Crp/Fnr family transcriptional regulator, partial [Alphaproteobacteria bacterium]|nr:Crp/Fnr family transcriptional regulator [Alphaproteobacteria bacterium]
MADWAEAADGSAGADGAPALASVEVFEGLDAAAVAALAAACRWLELPEGAVVATDLLGPGTVYFILAGRLTVTAAGKDGLPPDPPLCLGPQQTFGELHAMDSRGEPERAVAVGAVRLAACPRDLFRAFVQAQPALAQRLLTSFAHRLR